MHDGTPTHKSKATAKILRDHNINFLEWPGKSPELKTIENAWNSMKNKAQEARPSNINDMKEALRMLYHESHLLRQP